MERTSIPPMRGWVAVIPTLCPEIGRNGTISASDSAGACDAHVRHVPLMQPKRRKRIMAGMSYRLADNAGPVPPTGYLPIEEHGIVGDLRTVALVGTDGTGA